MSALYGGVARLRRTWYDRHPRCRRTLDCPVISVGNLVVGGSGKTPTVAFLARLLHRAGERPAVLSRGYGRRRAVRDVIVVSDGTRVLATVERSGDEPQWLAHALPGVPVLVSPDRYRAGRVARERFRPTVFLLDDGYQHLQLARDVDLLLVAPADLHERVLPAGRLREPLDAAGGADALLVSGDRAETARVSDALGVHDAFSLVTSCDAVYPLTGGAPMPIAAGSGRVVAVAGIARPHRFFAALRDRGWTVVREVAYADHHWFTGRDLRHIDALARTLDVDAIVTTEKDAVRLRAILDRPAVESFPRLWAVLPVRVDVEPAEAFASWLHGRLAAARGA